MKFRLMVTLCLLQDEGDEFEHFHDDEEFEGFDSEAVITKDKLDDKEVPKITITKVRLLCHSTAAYFKLKIM